MSKVESFHLILLAIIFLFTFFSLIVFARPPLVNKNSRPDRIILQLENPLKKIEMPSVNFQHDAHTQAVNDKCTPCHIEEKNKVVFKFKLAKEQASMALYHDKCVACHAKEKSAGKSFGPLSAECRSCHVKGETKKSSLKKIGFEKSLHDIHVNAPQIKGIDAKQNTNCSRCHHQYNAKTKEFFFTQGDQEACLYCHKAENKDDIRSIRQASHDSCINCHQSFNTQNLAAGPLSCTGCHDEQ